MFAVTWIIVAIVFGLGAALLALTLTAWAPIFAVLIALVAAAGAIAWRAARRTRDQSGAEASGPATRAEAPAGQRSAADAQPARGGGEGGALRVRG